MKKLIPISIALIMIVMCLAGCSSAGTGASSTAGSSDVASTDSKAESGKSLVIYFSQTGNTKKAAEEIAKQTGSDIVEIEAETPYTDEDITYEETCRSYKEQNDDKARPAIKNKIDNLDSYDVLYIGYPIWWSKMPRIMYTFFDTYDLAGKTIAPFCTSGSSPIDDTVAVIKKLEPKATVLDGLRVDKTSEITAWVDEVKAETKK